jgi:protein involved in polysaccharide export with SLBB domain
MEGYKMKKSLWISILIILLVYINWLSDGFAQTTPEQARAYQEMLKLQKERTASRPDHYNSPDIFNSDGEMINDSLLNIQRQSNPHAVQDSTDQEMIVETFDNSDVSPRDRTPARFGHHLFSNPHVGEINTSLIPEDYLLGPGDNIIVSLWGRVQQEWNLIVDRQGKIFIPKVGDITAWGMTLGQFEERLDARLSQVYTGYKRRVTLGKIRTIKVFLYGEVQAPGGYAVSALSTLFNALYMAGGPTENGSLRHIKLMRDQESVPIDLYDFLITGDKGCDLPLLSGDVIFVPLRGSQAIIRGEVRRPGIYELLGEEKISDLIELSGGPTAEAYLGRLMLDRVGDNDSRKVIDLDFSDPEKYNPEVADGDDLTVFSIYQMFENVVRVNGMVKHSGVFERTEGMCVSDLIEKGQILSNDVYLERADLYRRKPDGRVEIIAVSLDRLLDGESEYDLALDDYDSLYIFSIDEVVPQRHVYIEGLVQRPGKYPLYSNLTVADLIFLAGNLKNSAYLLQAELARIDSSGNTDLIQVSLGRLEKGDNPRLRENDRLFIRQIPGYELHRIVTLNGEVRFPGRYSLTQKNETLWQLLNRAGGFTDKAFPAGTIFKRGAIVGDLKRKNIDNILIGSQPLLADSTGILKPIPTMNIKPNGMDRIIIDMNLLMASNGAEGDFVLQSDDNIYVPETPTGISLLGEVSSNGTIKHIPNKNVKHYLEQAGGFTKRADKGEVRLIKANGRVYSSGGVQRRKVDLGDVIVVPSEIKKERDWLKYISTSLSILTGVATTVILVDRL